MSTSRRRCAGKLRTAHIHWKCFPGGFGTRGSVCLPLAAPIGLSPLHILTLCGPKPDMPLVSGRGTAEFRMHSAPYHVPLGNICSCRPQELSRNVLRPARV